MRRASTPSRLAAMAVDAEAAAASATAAADAAVASSLAGPKLVKRAGGRSTRVNPEVVIHTDQRKGRKQVTIVMGLDLFDIKLADAARACKKAFASGATVAKVCPGRLRGRATGTGCGGGRGGGWKDGPGNERVGGRGNDVGSGSGKGTVKGRKEVVGKGRRGRIVAKSLHGWVLAVTRDFRVLELCCVANWAPPSPACMHRRPMSRAGVLTSKRWCAAPLSDPLPPASPVSVFVCTVSPQSADNRDTVEIQGTRAHEFADLVRTKYKVPPELIFFVEAKSKKRAFP